MKTTHEEADVILPQQMLSAASNNQRIKVLSDDIVVFVLMAYHYMMKGLSCKVLMQETSSNRTIIDIGATVKNHKILVLQLWGMHALTGCDTVSNLWSIGKATAFKVLANGQQLHLLGNETDDLMDVITEAREFVATCYGSKI